MHVEPLRAEHWPEVARIYAEGVATRNATGFHVVGRRKRLGKLDGVWRDVLFMERRSGVVG